MGLLPLEFSDCILDSPYFRENLRAHEKQLNQTSQDIKGIIKDIQDVLDAAKVLTKAKRTLAKRLHSFRFDCIGAFLTDDEIIIANSLKEFGRFLFLIEDEMDRMLEHAYDKFITPLVNFRKQQIGSVKKTKKEFDKHTTKFCQVQDKYVNLSSKKEESLTEASELVRLEAKNLYSSSLEYVYLLQVVQERKKFEFAESVLSFMHSWVNYYKHGSSVSFDFGNYMNDLKARIQKSRVNYSITIERYDNFKRKMLEKIDPGVVNKMYTRQGYLYTCSKNKKNGNLKIGGSVWTKLFCQYQSKTKILTMIPYNQISGKITTTETIRVTGCVCKEEGVEKFRFLVIGEDLANAGTMISYTLQALTDWERKQWVEAFGGTWPAITSLQSIRADSIEENLNSSAYSFLKECLSELEKRGLCDQGLYRVGGVVSKVKELLKSGLNPHIVGQETLNLSEPKVWESKTIASAVKLYFRDLNKPLLTYYLYPLFIEAAKQDCESKRIAEIGAVLLKLPEANREILSVLIHHLNKVAVNSATNLMTSSNLGVCFGPTLLRPKEESVASIMDIKFCNEVIQILIENCHTFFVETTSTSYRKTSAPEMTSIRLARGNSVPKRTHSFSSFSQISTNSLPDIKEFHQAVEIRNSSCRTPREVAALSKNEDLMASLEMMTSLAADLPSTSRSPLQKSFTGSIKKINKKPPLPKLGTESASASQKYGECIGTVPPTVPRRRYRNPSCSRTTDSEILRLETDGSSEISSISSDTVVKCDTMGRSLPLPNDSEDSMSVVGESTEGSMFEEILDTSDSEDDISLDNGDLKRSSGHYKGVVRHRTFSTSTTSSNIEEEEELRFFASVQEQNMSHIPSVKKLLGTEQTSNV